MNRKEFQEWLEQFPEETIIEVMVQEEAYDYQSYGVSRAVTFSSEEKFEFEHFEFIDFVDNQFIKEDSPLYNKKILTLGSAI